MKAILQPPATPDRSIESAFNLAIMEHGDLELALELYSARIHRVLKTQCTDNRKGCTEESLLSLDHLHCSDLYLSTACGNRSERGWARFSMLYRSLIEKLSLLLCNGRAQGIDVADQIFAELFLPGRSGERRISSYDGRSSLSTWLRVVVRRRALNALGSALDVSSSLDSVGHDLPAPSPSPDKEVRAARYGEPVMRALMEAGSRLEPLDRLLLLMRYEQGLQVSDLARMMNLNPSNITRRIRRVQETIRISIVRDLKSSFGFSDEQIDECVADVLENPAYSILDSLNAAARSDAAD